MQPELKTSPLLRCTATVVSSIIGLTESITGHDQVSKNYQTRPLRLRHRREFSILCIFVSSNSGFRRSQSSPLKVIATQVDTLSSCPSLLSKQGDGFKSTRESAPKGVVSAMSRLLVALAKVVLFIHDKAEDT